MDYSKYLTAGVGYYAKKQSPLLSEIGLNSEIELNSV